MAKSPDAFRTISEVADWLGVEAHVLRFWETKFTQVKPVKRAGGRRYYRPSDMALLGGIRRLLHEEGMTIRGVQKVLREKGLGHVAEMSPELSLDGTAETAPRRSRRPATGDHGTRPEPPPGLTPDPEEAPTLPFDLPPRAAPAAPAAATDAGAADLNGPKLAPPRPVPAEAESATPHGLVRGVNIDRKAAADVLARARALADRLRTTPE